jgi:hypothetical protein
MEPDTQELDAQIRLAQALEAAKRAATRAA